MGGGFESDEQRIGILKEVDIFHGRQAPERGMLVGYGALKHHFELAVPLPEKLSIISPRHYNYEKDSWRVFGPRFLPADTLAGHLTFALKYEGVNLLLFKKLFETLGSEVISRIVLQTPTGQYSRRIWALYEWMMGEELPLPALRIKGYVPLLDTKIQYGVAEGYKMERSRVLNNLPGHSEFCPLIFRTAMLERYLGTDYAGRLQNILSGAGRDIVQRTAAFIQLSDSKASYSIEGETASPSRAMRWGRALGEAGTRPLSHEEFLRLQQLVIENPRFVRFGYRKEGGFVGEHDRFTGEPIVDHISARWEDLQRLMDGLLASSLRMEACRYPAVLAATSIAFGFVFIHPLIDGNGRLHRYLIHHMLAAGNFSPPNLLFPISAAILERMPTYRRVLESFSHPLLEFIKWERTESNNIRVLNITADYYKYFDATAQAEFLYDCIAYTVEHLIPAEVAFLTRRDQMQHWLNEQFEMPDRLSSLLSVFLEQNGGRLSKRARQKEFDSLTDEEVQAIEKFFASLTEKFG